MTEREEYLRNPGFLEFLKRQAEDAIHHATADELMEFSFGEGGFEAALEAFNEEEFGEEFADDENELGDEFSEEFADEFGDNDSGSDNFDEYDD